MGRAERNCSLTIREDAPTSIVYAALSGISTGDRLTLAFKAPHVSKTIRDEIIESKDSMEEILTEYRRVLVLAQEGPDQVPSGWVASLIDDDARELTLESSGEELRELAERNGGFAHVSGILKSFFCATTPEARDFLRDLLEELQK